MKRIRLAGVYEWGILAVLFLIVIHAPLSVGFGSILPDYLTIIKAWKEIVLTILGLVAIVLLARHKLWNEFLRAWPVRLSLAFIALHLFFAVVFRGQIESVVAGLMIDLRFIAMFLLSYTLILLRPNAVRRIVHSVLAGAVVVLGFGLLQITVLPDDVLRGVGYSKSTITPFTTIDSNPDFVRINSTLRGPNPLGAIAVVYGALALSYIVVRRNRLDRHRTAVAAAGIVSSTAVLFASYSRSAYIAFGVALGVILLMSVKLSRRIILSGLATAVLLTGGLMLVSSTDWYSNVILHEDPESTVISKSNDGHIESFKQGAQRAAVQPFGAGIGSTGSASLYDASASNDSIIENYYFSVAHESGWLGLILFGALFVSVLAAVWKQRSDWVSAAIFASGLGLAVIGLLLPVWADETVSFIWWGLAGALCAQGAIMEGRHGRSTRKQTTARTS